MTVAPTSYLVTGATGFIGKALVARLSQESDSVYCLVSPKSGQSERLPRLAGLIPIETGSTDPLLPDALANAMPEVVINLASYGVDPISRDPDALVHGNIGVMVQLIQGLRRTSPRVILHAGSWSEYAEMDGSEAILETHPISPRSVYGAAKAATSILGNGLARQAGIPFVTLRLFNVFGVGEAPHRLIPHLIDRLSRSELAELTPGDQIRDLTYVDDVVDAILVASKSPLQPYSAYNVCSGMPTQMRWVCETVAEMMGKPRDLLSFGAMPSREDEPQAVIGNNDHFVSATGWHPRISVEDGIRRMIAHHSRVEIQR